MDVGMAAYQQGRYGEAETALQSALREAERFSPKDPRVASTLKSLANLYYSQGRFGEAAPLQRRGQAIDEKFQKARDSSMPEMLGDLAATYLRQGRYEDAA